MKTGAIIADADGTLIENGELYFPRELVEVIKKARKSHLFSIASGRDLRFLQKLRGQIIEDETLNPYEAVIYEDVGLSIVNGESYVLGGIDQQTLERISLFFNQNPQLFAGLTPLPDGNFTLKTAWVTYEFADKRSTNRRVLEERFPKIKEALLSVAPEAEVKMSADAIDVMGNGLDKAIAFRKYVGLLKERLGIPHRNILVVGDAPNDKAMMINAVQNGGLAAYVGKDYNLERILSEFGNVIVTKQKGQRGTEEAIRKLILKE